MVTVMSEVLVNFSEQICTITLNRELKKNALTHAMYGAMADAINKAEQDKNIKAILINAKGDCFTAGNDMQDFALAGDSAKLADNVMFMNALVQCRLPIVASVNGLAVGIGTTMLLHCDLVIASESATFIMPFVDLALVPEFASSFLLPKLAGHRKASKWLMLGLPFSSNEAEQFGLVTDVVTSENLIKSTNLIMQQLVSKPKQSLLHTKALMKNDTEEILLHMNDELDIFVQQLSSPAAQEAFLAFLEKPKPDPTKYN